MKTTDPRDPLDQKIDALLSSRPLKPSDDFAARVLAAAEAEPTTRKASPAASPLASIIRFALPIAAVIAVALVLVPMLKQAPADMPQAINPTNSVAANATAPAAKTRATGINEAQAQELFLLEEGLSALAFSDSSDSLASEDLLSTLEALYYEI